MLYSAGMGAGILLRAVQEPVMMRESPPFKGIHTPEVVALEFTYYQWGIHTLGLLLSVRSHHRICPF